MANWGEMAWFGNSRFIPRIEGSSFKPRFHEIIDDIHAIDDDADLHDRMLSQQYIGRRYFFWLCRARIKELIR